ncbi:MAG: 5-formyltetrahydrofolate cyclo-ligase [Rhodobacteraceae bacterium]|nr:5-formyltetrahydrofolate cyclo-ligase [Paracoccaceae bacterium]
MSDIAVQKQAVRKAAMATRKVAHEAASGAGRAAANHLLDWVASAPKVRFISGYMPIRSEIDVLPAMHALFARGYQISVPVIVAKATPLRFRAWTPDVNMVDGPFGARVPESGTWHQPDLLLCPMLAFDESGQRMGYGGGFYDRSIAGLKAEKPVRAMGFAYAAQQVKALPHEPTDQRLDGVITECGIMWSRQ